jgi:hypothetical protein
VFNKHTETNETEYCLSSLTLYMKYGITIHGDDEFRHYETITVANETELCLRLAAILQALSKLTIEQFKIIHIARV